MNWADLVQAKNLIKNPDYMYCCYYNWTLNYFTGGDDYVPGVYNVTFEKGDTYKYFYVSIIDDDVYEGDETFFVSLERLPHGVVPAYPSTMIIKILDDECKHTNM